MREPPMGMEAEFAFAATGPDGAELAGEEALGMVNARVRERFPHLPALGGGIFLSNGGRLYLDNNHEEWCTPESPCPTTVVRHLFAGEKMLAAAADSLVREGKLKSATFSKINVDYSGTQASWGAHESYHHLCDPARLPREMIPFLASRLIFSGAGGFDPTSPTGCFFSVSPRASYITMPVSGCSTEDRGIFHTRDEPLAGQGHRLHVLVGESLSSSRGNWLKLATTSLCVALAEAGARAGKAVALQDPVRAMRTYAADPTCTATARSAAGRDLSAIDIQRHYLDHARRYVGTPNFPSWAGLAVEAWAQILERLTRAPAGVADCLDWGIKWAVYGSWLKQAGFSWDSLKWWGHVHSLLHSCASALPGKCGTANMLGKFILNPRGPLAPIVRALTPHLRARDMDWQQYDLYQRLRLQLFEVDTRFGQLGPEGIFNTLDAAKGLSHAFPGVDRIEQAMTEPPAAGRGNLRGRMVRQLHGSGNRYACYWDRLIDRQENRFLDLSDVSTREQQWQELRAASQPSRQGPQSPADSCPF